MRATCAVLLASIATLATAPGARAISVYMASDYDGRVLAPGDTVDIEVFLDADVPGIVGLSVGVQFSTDVFQYNPQSLAATGVPTYLLYHSECVPRACMNTYMVPVQDPFQLTTGETPPERSQVDVQWFEPTFAGTVGTGLGIKIGEIQIEVLPNLGSGAFDVIALTGSGGTSLLILNDDPNNPVPVPISGQSTLVVSLIPEPTTGALVVVGLLCLGLARSKRPA